MSGWLSPDDRFHARIMLNVISRFMELETGEGFWLQEARAEALRLQKRLQLLTYRAHWRARA